MTEAAQSLGGFARVVVERDLLDPREKALARVGERPPSLDKAHRRVVAQVGDGAKQEVALRVEIRIEHRHMLRGGVKRGAATSQPGLRTSYSAMSSCASAIAPALYPCRLERQR